MTLETAQLLCGAFEPGIAPYKRTHYNHPCAKWTRESEGNFHWLLEHGFALADEYTYRYEKVHKCREILDWVKDNQDLLVFPREEITTFYQAMPDKYKQDDVVEAYR